ncbi:MAG TPA: DUF1501 domain-containing protein [Phycisphaerales bacterium]|nr:DUF1501 domain-containing protein [Phycisphaerales bacterium]
MSHDETMSSGSCGCQEYRELSRRGFLGAVGGTAGAISIAAMAAPAWLPRVAMAKDYRSTQRDVMISIFLRGAADGLSMCVPFSEANYYAMRPTIAVPQPDSTATYRCTDLGVSVAGPNGPTGFGLPPGMTALLPAFQAGQLLFVHASGSTDPSRSHFDAQRFMEVGKPRDVSLVTGWLGRHLAATAPATPGSLLRALSISTALPRALVGGPLTLPIPNLDTFGLTGSSSTVAARTVPIQGMYSDTSDPLRSVGLNTLSTIDLLNTINFATYQPAGGAAYPTGSFGTAMKSTAALIKAQVGVEAIAIDLGGWDTHENQGTVPSGTTPGAMHNLMTTLATALAAFNTDMTALTAPTYSLVCMSEFGRRAAQTGTGTDHGHGNVMIVMGNAIHGGRVLTQWPGLNASQLYQGIDLQVTTDYRDIVAEIAVNRLGNDDLPNLFPGYTPTFRGVTL